MQVDTRARGQHRIALPREMSSPTGNEPSRRRAAPSSPSLELSCKDGIQWMWWRHIKLGCSFQCTLYRFNGFCCFITIRYTMLDNIALPPPMKIELHPIQVSKRKEEGKGSLRRAI